MTRLTFVQALVLLWPMPIRCAVYKWLIWIGKRLYGRTAIRTQRVPFGMIIKHRGTPPTAEVAAGRFVAKMTRIPVPVVIDVVTFPCGDHCNYYIVTETMPGKPLTPREFSNMSGTDYESYRNQLQGYLTELRSIVPPDSAKISAADGGECYDYRLHHTCGPFINEAAFDEHRIALAHPEEQDSLRRLLFGPRRRTHKLCFTHGDLTPMNILVDGAEITAIIDWECAGWYPEYWEGVKATHTMYRNARWVELIEKDLFSGYDNEYALEMELLKETCPV